MQNELLNEIKIIWPGLRFTKDVFSYFRFQRNLKKLKCIGVTFCLSQFCA